MVTLGLSVNAYLFSKIDYMDAIFSYRRIGAQTIRFYVFLLVFFCLNVSLMSQVQAPDSIFLYEGKIPGAIEAPDYKEQHIVKGILRVHKVQYPTLSVYLPEAEKANGSAVIICPGGGYSGLAWAWEGTRMAEWFNSFGVTAFVLKYRLPRWESDECRSKVALMDAQRAMRGRATRGRAGRTRH